MKLKPLIDSLDLELQKQGYSPHTMYFYRRAWKKISDYFDENGCSDYSEKLLFKYLDDLHDITHKKELGELSQYDISMVRVVCMLGDYHDKGTFLRRSYGKPILSNEYFLGIVDEYRIHCLSLGNRESTIKGKIYTISRMLNYFCDHGLRNFSELNSELLDQYITSLSHYKTTNKSTRTNHICNFLSFAYQKNYTLRDFSKQLPHFYSPRHAQLPSVWKKEEIIQMLNSVDRGNPSGKRDYAILMLVTHLGIRIGDVKKLKFKDFKWNTNRLDFIQSKTNAPISLPLLKEVGWAVIDYIKNGRPPIDTDYVFIRHCAPYAEFSEGNALAHIIDKYRKRAKLPSAKHKTGMHSLRHTLASNLLKNELSIDVISDILGHKSIDTTDIYLKIDIEPLRQCSLVPMEVQL